MCYQAFLGFALGDYHARKMSDQLIGTEIVETLLGFSQKVEALTFFSNILFTNSLIKDLVLEEVFACFDSTLFCSLCKGRVFNLQVIVLGAIMTTFYGFLLSVDISQLGVYPTGVALLPRNEVFFRCQLIKSLCKILTENIEPRFNVLIFVVHH